MEQAQTNLSEAISQMVDALLFLPALGIITACLITAFFAASMYKIYISAIGALGVGYGCYYVSMMLGLSGVIPTLPSIIGIAGGLVGFVTGFFLHKAVLFIGGAGIGAILGDYLVLIIKANTKIDSIVADIIVIACAIVIGIIVCLLFRVIYIILSSVGGLGIAGFTAGVLLFRDNIVAIIIISACAALIGIAPMVYQFKRYKNP